MTRSKKKAPEGGAAWLARVDTERNLHWHLESLEAIASKLIGDPNGARARQALEHLSACREAVRIGETVKAANAAFDACSALHNAYYAVNWLEDRHRGIGTKTNAARAASAGGVARSRAIRSTLHPEIVAAARNLKKAPGTTLAAVAKQLAAGAKMSARNVNRILKPHKADILSANVVTPAAGT